MPATFRALRRTYEAAESFPNDVLELQRYLSDDQPRTAVNAYPGRGTKVPLTILGSSLFGRLVSGHESRCFPFLSQRRDGGGHCSARLGLQRIEIYPLEVMLRRERRFLRVADRRVSVCRCGRDGRKECVDRWLIERVTERIAVGIRMVHRLHSRIHIVHPNFGLGDSFRLRLNQQFLRQ